ncbi:MAG: DUF86 domain-containing protein [Bacteroidaceae bacterium]|nr:DUF86 domain-containing protein [Bacteroidaceae bacterium]
MREPVRDKGRLQHIVEASQILLKSKDEESLENIKADPVKFYGYVKLVEIIGEASYKLTKEYKDAHPEVPWQLMAGMRHVLVHDYYNISPAQLWKTITKDIPVLVPIIEKLLEE